MSVTIVLRPPDGFAGDTARARRIRASKLRPALAAGESVVLDFAAVAFATHSYVHALLAEALTTDGEALLGRIEFRSCSPPVRSAIELVVGYSLGGLRDAV